MVDPFDFDTATFSNLVKAVFFKIKENGDPDLPDGATPVLFNPTQLSVQMGNRLPEQRAHGSEQTTTQWTGGDAKSMSMELFFDTLEEKVPVTVLTEGIEKLAAKQGPDHEPPPVRFLWGALLSFNCRIERVDTTYTLFLPTGIPVRARMNVTLKQYTPVRETELAENTPESADRTTVWRVTAGDSLWGIAAVEYGDPEAWRPIAEANGIDDPRSLQPGRELVVPPLEP